MEIIAVHDVGAQHRHAAAAAAARMFLLWADSNLINMANLVINK